jgi:GNAT superfamily N-acetyltransferase
MHAALEVVEQPTDEQHGAILAALVAFNQSQGPPNSFAPLAIIVRDEDDQVAGGLWGHTTYDWLFVQLLVVPEALRGKGLGSEMLREAEGVARRRACIGAWLDTYSFQARGFYVRLGYKVVGSIEDHPVGGARYILAKRFEQRSAD